MSVSEFVVIACACAVSMICGSLIFHRAYKDRLPRRSGLALISLSGFVQIALVLAEGYEIRPLAVLLWGGLALFFYSHICSFITRLKNKDRSWYESTDTAIVMKGRPKP